MLKAITILREWAAAVIPGFNRRAALRAAWGMRGDKDGWLASRAFDLSRTASHAQWLDDKTWADLELPSIFATINTTVSPLGSQMLFKQLREYQYDSHEMSSRYAAYDAFKADGALREECQLALTVLDTDSAAHVADLVLGPLPNLPNHRSLVFLLAGASLATLALTIGFGVTLWLWLGILTANIALIVKMNVQISRDAGSLLVCWQMLNVADRLAKIRTEKRVASLQQLHASKAQRAKLRQHIRWFALASSDSTPIAGLAVALNICFLVKLIAYLLTIDKIGASRTQWRSTFELIGTIDASIAIANFLHRMPQHCRPTISYDKLISFAGMVHPLLSNSVECSVRLNNRSALITGSNMTGKTTFIKTVAINIILGNTLGVCLATTATIPNSGVMTSIRSDHSVESGRSRYSAEVHTIIQMLQSLASGECRVFAIDEPFSGTNTIERIAIAKAVLNAMSLHAQVLVTTHDVELQPLLTDTFDLYHFREDPNVEGFFDYKLRTGASTEQNAIKVLARMGFPDAILAGALAHIGPPAEN